jgi:hypothetical protein
MPLNPHWITEGKRKKAKWLVVVCDTFDWSDHPCFFKTDKKMKAKVKNPGEMQRIMEVYDLRKRTLKNYHDESRVRDDL